MTKTPTPLTKAKPQVPKGAAKKRTHAVFIYGLVDPVNGEIRYIGKSVNPQNRYRQHLAGRAGENPTPKSRWIDSLKAIGSLPDLKIIEECTDENWEERERYHIAQHRSTSPRLKNLADGGNQPLVTPAQRKVNAATLNTGKDAPINRLLKRIGKIRSDRLKRGDISGYERFGMVADLIASSQGDLRERYQAYAQQKRF